MATFAQAKKRSTKTADAKPIKLSVGHPQVIESVSIDLDAISRERWLMTVLNGDQFGFQIQQHPLRLDSPRGLIVWFVDEKGKPVATNEPDEADEVDTDDGVDENDDAEMSIMDGADVVNMLSQYIGQGDIKIVEGKFPPLVRIVTAPINHDMLT